MERLRAVREERREDHLEAVDGAERDVEDGAGAVAVGLDERPGRLVGDVLVDLGREPHRLAERGAEAAALDQRADLVEAGVDRREQRLVGLGELAGLRHLAEVAVRVRERAVDEVAPVREQLVVVAADELGPGEVGVLRLRARGDEVVAERVGVVALEEVAHARSSSRGSSRTACPPS